MPSYKTYAIVEHAVNRFILPTLTFLAFSTLAANDAPEKPKLSLSAHSTLSIPADELQLSVGVITLRDTAEAALTENSSKMKSVIEALEAAGLPKSDYKTSQFNIHPTYTPYPKEAPQNWKPSINGYEVSNAIYIKTEKLDLAGKLIDAASKAGANSIDNIQFAIKDSRSRWDESIRQATLNALKDAEVIAAAANVKLVQLLSVSLENGNIITPQSSNMRYTKMMAVEAAPPIKAEDIEVTATVNIIYEIAPLK